VRWFHLDRRELQDVLSRGGGIDFSVEAFWLTRVGLIDLRAELTTLRERGFPTDVRGAGQPRHGDGDENALTKFG
jgi:hypothetical protein